MKFMIVGDDIDMANFILETLKVDGVSCDIAESAETAHKLFVLNNYDALIVDAIQTGVNGMENKIKILAVDDDPYMREMFNAALGGAYQVMTVKDGHEALVIARAELPGLILLDVKMPGMDGYEVCLKIKQEEALAAIPVIFVSGNDRIDERLRGYEVGGSDYVVKPFNEHELKAKINHLLDKIAERAQLKEMANYATSTAMTAMTSMSEMGTLLESLKKFNASTEEKALAESVLSGLSEYGLGGVVQVRMPEKKLSLSAQGEASPLEISVIEHMAGMERIVQFKNRLSINYPHVSILVSNMTMDDPDRCGRLRDHLATLIEGAEIRVTGIIAENESRRRGIAIEQMIERVTAALNRIDANQRQNRMDMRIECSAMLNEVEKALLWVALTTEQEEFLSNIVTTGIEKILSVQSADTELQNKLSEIVKEMRDITG